MAALEVLSVMLFIVALGFAALGCRQDMNDIIIRPRPIPRNRIANRSKRKKSSEIVSDKTSVDDTKKTVSLSSPRSPPSYKSVIG
jgi:hypothetical protein